MKKILFLYLLVVSFIYANEDWLSQKQQKIISQENSNNSLEQEIKENSWISPINIEASISKSDSNPGNSFSLSEISLNLNQDIYRFGGIDAIKKQALYQYQYSTTNQDIHHHEMLCDIFSLTLQIKQSVLIQEQTNYSINNQQVRITAREEGYIQGVNDILEVDNAHIELSELQESLEDEKIRELQLKEALAKLSDWNYKSIQAKILNPLNLSMFIQKNNINATSLEIKLNEAIAKEYKATNFPVISIFGSISRKKEDITYNSSSDIGLKISWTWDINRKKRIEQSRINTMLAQSKFAQKTHEEKLFFNRLIKEQRQVEKKISLHKKALKRYKNLYARTKELIENNLGIPDDLVVINNTLKTKQIATQVEMLNQELLLVQLYRHTTLSL